MANAQETRQKILDHFKANGWSIPDVASALNITEQYLRKILNKKTIGSRSRISYHDTKSDRRLKS